MYGDFEMNPGSSEPGHRTRTRRKSRDTRRHDIPDGGPNDELHAEEEIEEYFKNRNIRQSFGKNRSTESGRYRLGIEILIKILIIIVILSITILINIIYYYTIFL